MFELEAALEKILSAIPPPRGERIPLAQAHGRVLLGKISAPIPLPAFDNSSVDGYGVRAEDVASAGPQTPVRLRVAGKAAAGENFGGKISAGECVRIFTGSPIPAGADAVVMQEDTRLEPAHAGDVLILDAVKPWENVRFRGEDVKLGATLAESGDLVTAGRISLLAATGVAEIEAAIRPVVGVLATGSELIEAPAAPGPGKIYESNRAALAPLIFGAGGIPKIFPIVPDELKATRAALDRAFAECDIVITCGGVSVGEFDFVKAAFEQLGGALEFWRVAIKPGRPFVFGRVNKKFLFGLPGNPVSAFVTFLLLARPALLRAQGAANVSLPSHPAVLAEPLANPGGRRHFMRVTIDERGEARSAGFQASHVLSSLAAADGLVDVPPQTTFPAGTTVTVLRWSES